MARVKGMFKVNDHVKSEFHGKGVVVEINFNSPFPVSVRFEDYPYIEKYMTNGRDGFYNADVNFTDIKKYKRVGYV